MNLYEAFETDEKIENDQGITLDYGKAGKIRIHRAGGSNQKFINYYRAQMKPYTRQIQSGTMDNEVANKLLIDIYAKTIIIGWEGIKDRNNVELEFNYNNVSQVLTDLPTLFQDIQASSQDATLFRKEIVEDVVGNSQAPSTGTTDLVNS
jgi:hypothetical protein